MKAVPGIAALDIDPEGWTDAVGASHMRVAGSSAVIPPNEHGVVILSGAALGLLAAFVDESGVDEVVQHRTADHPVLKHICVDMAHGVVSGRQLERFLLFLLWGRGTDFPLFTVQKPGHGLRIAEVIKLLDERDWPAALLGGVVEPLVSPDGDTVVAGKALFSAAGQELLSL